MQADLNACIAKDKEIYQVNIFYLISSHEGASNEYPHTISLRNKENIHTFWLKEISSLSGVYFLKTNFHLKQPLTRYLCEQNVFICSYK